MRVVERVTLAFDVDSGGGRYGELSCDVEIEWAATYSEGVGLGFLEVLVDSVDSFAALEKTGDFIVEESNNLLGLPRSVIGVMSGIGALACSEWSVSAEAHGFDLGDERVSFGVKILDGGD